MRRTTFSSFKTLMNLIFPIWVCFLFLFFFSCFLIGFCYYVLINCFTTESNHENSMVSEMVSSVPPKKTVVEEFLNSENDKSDYEW